MTGELSLEQRRARIDDRLEWALEPVRGAYLAPARSAVLGREGRWYGQLVALVSNPVAETPDDPSTLRAATAVELFAGYRRLRERLLIRLDDAEPAERESDAALLASDYLHTAAYSTLGSLERADAEACIGTLASVSESIVEALADADLGSQSPAAYGSFADATDGELGRGAAVVGATLAGADERYAARAAALGRGFGAGRRIRRTIARDAGAARVEPSALDERARRRLEEGRRALRALSSVADVDSLRAFLEEELPETGRS